MQLIRRAILVVSSTFALLCLIGWALSYARLQTVSHKHGWLEPPRSTAPPPAADPYADQWAFHALTLTGMHARGAVRVIRSEYISFDPRREELDRWHAWYGWEFESMTARADRSGGTFYHAPADWRAVGFGLYSVPGLGGESRVFEAPYWFLFAGAVTPILVIWRRARRTAGRLRRGECLKCGYPLSGAPICSECGRPSFAPDSAADSTLSQPPA